MIRASAFASQVVVVSEVSDEWAVCRGSGCSWLLIISMTLDSVQSNSLQELSWSVMEHDNMRQWWPASGNTRNIMSWDLTPDILLVLIHPAWEHETPGQYQWYILLLWRQVLQNLLCHYVRANISYIIAWYRFITSIRPAAMWINNHHHYQSK